MITLFRDLTLERHRFISALPTALLLIMRTNSEYSQSEQLDFDLIEVGTSFTLTPNESALFYYILGLSLGQIIHSVPFVVSAYQQLLILREQEMKQHFNRFIFTWDDIHAVCDFLMEKDAEVVRKQETDKLINSALNSEEDGLQK